MSYTFYTILEKAWVGNRPVRTLLLAQGDKKSPPAGWRGLYQFRYSLYLTVLKIRYLKYSIRLITGTNQNPSAAPGFWRTRV
jgi:hypothetical protein